MVTLFCCYRLGRQHIIVSGQPCIGRAFFVWSIHINYIVNHLKICIKFYICIELVFFPYGAYECAVLLQARSTILVVVPFRVYCIVNLPTKYVLVVISGDSIMIGSRNAGCRWSVTKWEKCEGSAKSAKEVQNGCKKIHVIIL